MKQIIKHVISAVCICSFATTFGQTPDEIEIIKQQTNVEYLKTLSTEFENQYRSDKRRALEMGWPEKVVLPSGKTLHLQGMLDAETPLYYTTTNREAGITTRANKLYSGGGLGLSVHGEGMTAGVWDGGAIRETHESFENRAIQMDGAVEPTMLTNGYDHATHVTGTVIASDQFENGSVRGMAFKGNVHAYDWNGDNGEMADAASNGLLLSNHSYGQVSFFGNGTPIANYRFGKYTSSSAKWDEIMYNAPFYQIVKSAGNDRNEDSDYGFHPQTLNKGGYDLLKEESVSKNVLVVAATKEVSEYNNSDSVSMTDFSSWGATDDGRIKPDIAAQGLNVKSSSAEGDDAYNFKNGTSMAAPSVTGTLLLLQQHYMNTYNTFMKSATLRALIIHSANEAGDDPGPDYKFGWGLMNARTAAIIISNNQDKYFIKENTLENGATDIIRILPDDNSWGAYIEATLAWTDPEGVPISGNVADDMTPMLVNDLDIRITDGTTTYYPWKLGGLFNLHGAATMGDNRVDNVEKIQFYLPPSMIGKEYTVQISHKGSLQNGHQDYSLIITGIKRKECPENLLISTTVNANEIDLHNANIKIEANNTIAANGVAIYHAGRTVELTNGFKADAGAKFKAYIEGCTNVFKNKYVTPKERKVVTYDIKRSDDLEIKKGDIRLYPNTTNGLTTLYLDSFDENKPNYDVEVYTLEGRRMKSFKMTKQTAQFDISDLSSGLYLVKVINGNTMYTKKLIKE
ncbi:MAG: S8 family serine peptidase [Kordia sp.]|uniref:S8 family serine peptidase n=1 Tax=Kordia sp. TaxID=1965332 RepID=UPI00385E1ECD